MRKLLLVLVALTGMAAALTGSDVRITDDDEASTVDELPYKLALADDARLSWSFNLRTNLIAFNIEVPAETRVVGLGFSDRGEIPGADFGIVHIDAPDMLAISDFKVSADMSLHRLPANKYKLANSAARKRSRVITISRPMRVKEFGYYSIDRGTTHLLFFKSFFVWDRLADYDISVHLAQLIKSQLVAPPPQQQPDAFPMEIRVSDVRVPPAATTYWCRVVEMPLMPETHHIIGYEPVISEGSEGLVHHLEVFLCLEEPPESVRGYDAACNSETKPLGMTSCRKVLGAWAMGATGISYPAEAGLPIGGTASPQYAVIELHYNNEAGSATLRDSSGLRFHVTKRLRKFDVGILELGLDYLPSNAVPPGQPRFDLTGFCLPQCTEAALPSSGIRIFASQLHTHTSGVQVRTVHLRPPCTRRVLNEDRHYSPHFQEIRLLPRAVRVMPGDALITTCTYDSSKRKNITLGGLSISNEMCVNYVFYYPKTQLEVCKSLASQAALDGFFRKMNILYGADTSRKKSVEENYRSIAWGRMEVASLRQLYRTGGIRQSCNTSAGIEFPGHNWDNLKTSRSLCREFD